jgi:DnaJ-domain-containing protein 1
VLWQGFDAFVSGPTTRTETANSRGDADTFFRIAGGLVMGAAGLIGASVLTHKATTKICRASVRGVVRHLERASIGLDALRDAEANIRNVAQEIGVDWPEGLTENVGAFLSGQCDSLLLHARAFRCHVASALQQAEGDLACLSKARDCVRTLRTRFRDASAAANRADAITLIHELEAMHEAMTSESMTSLLIERRWSDFASITKDMQADLTRVEQQARRYERCQQPQSEAATESEFRKACRILGCDENTTPGELKQRYRELANSFHPDKSSQATPAVRALAEERFKEIQQAWETIKAVHAA